MSAALWRRARVDRSAGRRFSLVELLAIVAVLGMLVALLLPALERARMRARSAICMGQLRQVSTALLLYAADNDTHLPYVNANANPSTSQTHPFGERSGYGYLVLHRYVSDHRILYCPDAFVFDGWGGAAAAGRTRLGFIKTLAQDVANSIDRRVDYNLGWWGGSPTLMQYESGAGFGRATGGRRSLYWACDDFGIFPYYYRVVSHGTGHFMNVARLDGGVSTLIEWKKKQPTTGNYGYYYPYNDRPGWGWWRYFGTGLGFD